MEEKIQQFVSVFKFPLILASIGTFLTIFSLILLIRQTQPETDINFVTEATGSGSVNSKITIDIEGSVLNPGVYEFTEGARIDEAIKRAGGLTTEADSGWIEKNINKAAKLTDGGKIFIPKKGDTKTANIQAQPFKASEQTLGISIGFININSASQSELESLSGVGPATAIKIIEGRPYQTIDELKAKKVVGSALYDKIKDKLTI